MGVGVNNLATICINFYINSARKFPYFLDALLVYFFFFLLSIEINVKFSDCKHEGCAEAALKFSESAVI